MHHQIPEAPKLKKGLDFRVYIWVVVKIMVPFWGAVLY